jgi:hypothetical protein
VALGLWLIATGFIPTGPPTITTGPQMSARPQTTAGPMVLGLALLGGGALFFILLLRKP